MKQTSNFLGKARITSGFAGAVLFLATDTASTIKSLTLDPNSATALFLDVAGNTNIKVEVTFDGPEAVSKGRAVYAAAKTFTATAVAGYLGKIAKGATSVRITQSKQGAGTDDVNAIAAIGGRAVVRATPVGDTFAADTGIGAYTALTSA